jgi:uncharacterized protein
MSELLPLLLLIPAGLIAGVVNTLAGGGSFLTLPALLLFGLSEQLANGTNRVAILIQTAYAAYLFDRHERIERVVLGRLVLLLLPGALVGIYVASRLSAEMFRGWMGGLFLLFAALMLLNRRRLLLPGVRMPRESWLSVGALILVGVYGGFLQAGVGLLLLLCMRVFSGTELLDANGLKLALVAVWTLPAVLWFAACGQVEWLPGLALGVGQLLGANLGTRLAFAKGNPLIFTSVLAVMLATAAHLLWQQSRLWLGG